MTRLRLILALLTVLQPLAWAAVQAGDPPPMERLIAGAGQPDPVRRRAFIEKNVLTRKDSAVDTLHLLSHLIKADPSRESFRAAFVGIIEQAPPGWIMAFLEREGFRSFNRHTDEYTRYDPAKLAHLPDSAIAAIRTNLATRRQVFYREWFSEKKAVLRALDKVRSQAK